MVLKLSALVFRTLFRVLFRARIHGLGNIPSSGPAILAFNHASYADPLLVGGEIGVIRPFHSIGKKELFAVPLLGAYLRAVGTIPLDRDNSDPGALRAALDALKAGELFVMAPEGTRGKTGRPRTPKPGVAFLSHHSGAPVIPVRLEGTEGWPVPGRLWVRFGEPVRFESASVDPKELGREYRAFAERLMRGIYDMKEPL